MERSILLGIAVFLMTACSDSGFRTDVKTTSLPQGAGGTIINPGPQTSDGSHSTDSPLIAPAALPVIPVIDPAPGPLPAPTPQIGDLPASIPVPIGGASLTCSVASNKTEILCETKSRGERVNVAPSQMYGVSRSNSAWQALAFRSTALGLYTATAQDTSGTNLNLSSIATVLMRSGDSPFIAALVKSDLSLFDNIIVDGSFEAIAASANESSFYSANTLRTLSTNWQVEFANPLDCADADPTFELRSAKGAADGKQFAAMDTRCLNPRGKQAINGGENVTINQNVYPKQDNYYLVVFSVKRGLVDSKMLEGDAGLTVKWGDTEKAKIVPSDAEWNTYNFVVKAKSTAVWLGFIETGLANRNGTWLDDVKVLNLGSPSD